MAVIEGGDKKKMFFVTSVNFKTDFLPCFLSGEISKLEKLVRGGVKLESPIYVYGEFPIVG